MVNQQRTFKTNKVSRNRKAIIAFLLISTCTLCLTAQVSAADVGSVKSSVKSARITVIVDPRVELISIIFRLAGNSEYNQGTPRPYVKVVEKHFGDFDNHPAVKMAAELRNICSMGCDGPMSLAVHIDRNFRLRKTSEQWPSTLDKRWQKQQTEEFLEKVRQFANDTKFAEFFKAQSQMYETGIRSFMALIGPLDIGQWLVDYFGFEDCGDMNLVPGFVNGFSNYGPRFVNGDKKEKYAIVGMRPFDQENTVKYRSMQLDTIVHEFCHSFANPCVEKYMEQLRPAGEKLFAAHAAAMSMRGYQRWGSMMYETATRACVMSFVRHKLEPMYLKYFIESENRAGFVWIEDVGNFLKTYDNQRDKYPTFESFFPEFVTFLNEYSKKAAR